MAAIARLPLASLTSARAVWVAFSGASAARSPARRWPRLRPPSPPPALPLLRCCAANS